jgi:hypothetical protein
MAATVLLLAALIGLWLGGGAPGRASGRARAPDADTAVASY